tara:strand:+ start:2913 stop:3560 length:648 start_codon:yes stop_codon:yes gene_type:complete
VERTHFHTKSAGRAAYPLEGVYRNRRESAILYHVVMDPNVEAFVPPSAFDSSAEIYHSPIPTGYHAPYSYDSGGDEFIPPSYVNGDENPFLQSGLGWSLSVQPPVAVPRVHRPTPITSSSSHRPSLNTDDRIASLSIEEMPVHELASKSTEWTPEELNLPNNSRYHAQPRHGKGAHLAQNTQSVKPLEKTAKVLAANHPKRGPRVELIDTVVEVG